MRCPKCGTTWRTLPDESQDHDCPRCGPISGFVPYWFCPECMSEREFFVTHHAKCGVCGRPLIWIDSLKKEREVLGK